MSRKKGGSSWGPLWELLGLFIAIWGIWSLYLGRPAWEWFQW